MTNPEPRETQGDAPEASPNGNQLQSWPMKILMYLVVAPIVLFWESTTGLYTRTYQNSETHDTNVLNLIIGVIVSLVAGIGIGYHMGWVSDPPASLVTWLSTAVGATAAVFIYGWTLLHFLIFRHAFRLSEKLWKNVNLDATERYRHSGNTSASNPSWFSVLLMAAAWIGVALLTATVFWQVTTYIQGHQEGWSWLGGIVGIAAIVIAAIVVIAILGFIASESGGFAFLLVVLLAGFCWWKWTFVSGLSMGLYNNLTGSDWGSWGYVPGGIVGVIAGAITAGITGTLLYNLRVRVIAVVVSAAATYALVPLTTQYVGGYDLGAFGFVSPVLPWVASALEFFVIIGFLFPLAHIVITHAFKKLADIPELMESAYDEAKGGYREFFLAVLTLVATGATIWYGPALAVAYGGFTSLWLVYSATAAAAVLVYTLGGKLIFKMGVFPFALGVSGLAAFESFQYYVAQGLWYGKIGGAVAGVAGFALTIAVLFPLAYIVVRYLTQGWLGAALRNPLVNTHQRVCSGIVNLVEELFQAARHTYGDATPYRDTFLQLANLAATGAITYGAWIGSAYLGFALWLTIVATAAALVASYVLVGQLFKKQGVGLVGLLAAIVGGVAAGIMVHGSQPFGYWLSVPGGLVGAALTAGAVFPWAYLLLRAILNFVSQETWLRPVLVNAHEKAWTRFSTLRRDFRVVYAQVRDTMKRMKDDFYRNYEQIRAQIFRGKK